MSAHDIHLYDCAILSSGLNGTPAKPRCFNTSNAGQLPMINLCVQLNINFRESGLLLLLLWTYIIMYVDVSLNINTAEIFVYLYFPFP